MKLTTNLNELQKLELASLKAKRLCKLYKCSIIDLIVISIDAHSIAQKENKK